MDAYDISLPGAAQPIRTDNQPPPPPMVAWWKEQLENQAQPPPQIKPGRNNRRQSASEYDSDESQARIADADLVDEVDELREALKAARRQLDAGERRERALRRALRRADLPPVGGGGAAAADEGASSRGPRLPIGKGGLLDQALIQSGMLNTEEGRLQIAEMLARATQANGGGAPGGGGALGGLGSAPLPMPPAMMERRPPASRAPTQQLPTGFMSGFQPGIEPAATDVSDALSGGAAPAAANRSRTVSGSIHNTPALSATGAQQPPPLQPLPQAAVLVPPPPPPPVHMPFVMRESDLQATCDGLLEVTLKEEVSSLVKSCVRSMVQSLLPSAKRGHKSKEEGGIYGQIFNAILADLLAGEAKEVVGESIEAVAADYVVRRGAERTFQAMVEEILRDELSLLAADARVEVVYDRMLDAAMEPIVREVVVAAMHEARGAAARRREAEERQQVATRAAEGLFERLCLQRFLQHIATSGEVLLLQRQAAQLLDELVGEGLARRALSVGQEHVQLQSSAVLGAAHQRIAYAALVDEFLAQLRVLSASGLEAGVPPQAEETDTGSEGSDEEYVS
jgi:hypothetical protein